MKADSIPTDADLVRRANAGEQRAFSLLVAQHKHWLYRFIRRHVGDADEAYDVMQDAFVSAMSNLNRFDPERPFEAWIRRIALNKCRDHARYNAVRRMLGLRRPEGENADLVADLAPGAEATISTKAALVALDKAIGALPAGLKEPLILTLLEGLSHKDAGQILGLSAKAVEVRVYRAKRLLAETLDRDVVSDLLTADVQAV